MAEPRPRPRPESSQVEREIPKEPGSRERPVAPVVQPVSPEQRALLERQLNYHNNPGYHTLLSPAVGSRSQELIALRYMAQQRPYMISFADALYQPQFVHLIPPGKARQAEAVARDIFQRYLSRYPGSGLDQNNAVIWNKMDLTRTYIADLETPSSTWMVQPSVYNRTHLFGGRCLPKFVAAYHEFMHVEETPRGARSNWSSSATPDPTFGPVPGSGQQVRDHQTSADEPEEGIKIMTELMPTIATIVISDEIYKRVNRIPVTREAQYGMSVNWDGHSVPLGRIANFYRGLFERYGSWGAAVGSPESLEFMRQGQIPPSLITPVRTR